MLFMKDSDTKDAEENTTCIPAVKTCTQESSGTSLRDLGCGLLGAGFGSARNRQQRLALA